MTAIAMAELPLHYSYYLLVTILIPLLAAIPLLRLHSSAARRRRSGAAPLPPPSPWALPVVGHLHHLAFASALPHRAMRDLARRLGPLMLLRLGELRVVVASSADAAREVMRTHDLAFATRPLSPTAMALLGDGSLGLVFAPYGDGWRQLRRLCTAELLSARRVRSFRVVREDEVRRLLRSVAAKASPVRQQKQQALVDLSEMVSAYVADASVRAIIGSKFRDRDTFLRLLERRLRNVPAQSLPDLFPSWRLATLVSPTLRLLKRERRDMMAFIDTIIQEHQDSRGAADDDDEEEDLLDVLLRIQREDELDPPLTTENIKAVIIVRFPPL
jgi:cytochrome P450